MCMESIQNYNRAIAFHPETISISGFYCNHNDGLQEIKTVPCTWMQLQVYFTCKHFVLINKMTSFTNILHLLSKDSQAISYYENHHLKT